MFRVHFIDAKRGIATGDHWLALGEDKHARGIILYTDDGGQHWQPVWDRPFVKTSGLSFVDTKTGWMTAETVRGSLLLKSTNGGRTWIEQELKNIGGTPRFLDTNRGSLDLGNDVILVTTDAGKTWSRMRKPIHKYPWHFSELFK